MLIMVMTHDIRTRNVNHVVHEVLQKKGIYSFIIIILSKGRYIIQCDNE